MPKRQGSVKILMRGIFASAKVVRGQDWKWERQDGMHDLKIKQLIICTEFP